MTQLHRRELLAAGSAATLGAVLPRIATARDQSTLAGAGKTAIERYLLLQEGVLQRTRAAQAMMAPTRAPRRPVNTVDRVLMWHEVAMDSNALDYVPPLSPGVAYHEQFGPHRSSRAMAVGQMAVFEAVNAGRRKFHSHFGFAAPGGAWSVDAAIAQAAFAALTHLYPPQTDRLNAILIDDLAAVHDAPPRIMAGRKIGAAAFQSVLSRLGNDHTDLPEPLVPTDYQPSGAIGEWNVDPVSMLPLALGGNWPKVTPITFRDQAQFRAPPPPAVNSAAFQTVFAETMTLGGDPRMGTATTRTDQETFLGKFWSYDGTPGLCAPPRLYNQIARQLILKNGMTEPCALARFLALINVGMADAGVSAWEAKFHYKYWRPITAIRWPGMPGGDSNWYPLGAQATNTGGPNFTPPFPAYPSGHATFGGALFEMLRAFMPDATPFTFVSDEFNGQNKDVYGNVRPLSPAHFTSLTDAESSNAMSRIWLGVHWRFDADQGVAQGHRVARHVLETFATPA